MRVEKRRDLVVIRANVDCGEDGHDEKDDGLRNGGGESPCEIGEPCAKPRNDAFCHIEDRFQNGIAELFRVLAARKGQTGGERTDARKQRLQIFEQCVFTAHDRARKISDLRGELPDGKADAKEKRRNEKRGKERRDELSRHLGVPGERQGRLPQKHRRGKCNEKRQKSGKKITKNAVKQNKGK